MSKAQFPKARNVTRSILRSLLNRTERRRLRDAHRACGTGSGAIEPLERRVCLSVTFAPVSAGAGANATGTATAVGDFNEDGRPDLVLRGETGSVVRQLTVLLGRADGSFDVGTPVQLSDSAIAVTVGDYNSDGHADIEILSYSPAERSYVISTRAGAGDGTFASSDSQVTPLGSYFTPTDISAGDFNADGRADLAIAVPGGNRVDIYLGVAGGYFGSGTAIYGGSQPNFVTVTDFNHDGRSDVAVEDSSSRQIKFYLSYETNYESGVTFGAGTTPVYTRHYQSLAKVGVADFNGDGRMDVVEAFSPTGNDNDHGEHAVVFLQGSDGTFDSSPGIFVTGGTGGGRAHAVAAADFNGDGRADIGLTSFSSTGGHFTSLLNTSTPDRPAPAGNGDGLYAIYYNNTDFTGSTVKEVDRRPALSTDALPAGITPDTFSVRWTGKLQAVEAGDYQFRITSADGARLFIDGGLYVDRWSAGTGISTSVPLHLSAGQSLNLKVEYFHNTGYGLFNLEWKRPGGTFETVPASRLFSGQTAAPSPTPPPAPPPPPASPPPPPPPVSPPPPPPPGSSPTGTGDGLSAIYFDNKDFTSRSGFTNLKRVDSTIDFDYGTGAPAAGYGADTFSVRWTGKLQAVEAGNYQFRIAADDGVRLWVNGKLIIDRWSNGASTKVSGLVALAAGQKVDIKVEYFDDTGPASIKLEWLRPGGAFQVIPRSQLYSK